MAETYGRLTRRRRGGVWGPQSEGGRVGRRWLCPVIASFIDFKEHHQVAQSRDNITPALVGRSEVTMRKRGDWRCVQTEAGLFVPLCLHFYHEKRRFKSPPGPDALEYAGSYFNL